MLIAWALYTIQRRFHLRFVIRRRSFDVYFWDVLLIKFVFLFSLVTRSNLVALISTSSFLWILYLSLFDLY